MKGDLGPDQQLKNVLDLYALKVLGQFSQAPSEGELRDLVIYARQKKGISSPIAPAYNLTLVVNLLDELDAKFEGDHNLQIRIAGAREYLIYLSSLSTAIPEIVNGLITEAMSPRSGS